MVGQLLLSRGSPLTVFLDNGLPTDVRRTSESALSGLKHSVKASIGLFLRLYS